MLINWLFIQNNKIFEWNSSRSKPDSYKSINSIFLQYNNLSYENFFISIKLFAESISPLPLSPTKLYNFPKESLS